ncbi:hypothetical protein ACHAWF_002603 [Thalassiosira exigua]
MRVTGSSDATFARHATCPGEAHKTFLRVNFESEIKTTPKMKFTSTAVVASSAFVVAAKGQRITRTKQRTREDSAHKQPGHAKVDRFRALDEITSMPMSFPMAAETVTAMGAKSGKETSCTIEDVEGKYKLEYDFYEGELGDYKFPVRGGLTFSRPNGAGKGVMKVNYCFAGDNSREMVAVQTGFAENGRFPLKIVKYEDQVNVTQIYNEYRFDGQYDCNTEKLFLGFAGYFDSNAFTLTMPAEKDDNLEFNAYGCPE